MNFNFNLAIFESTADKQFSLKQFLEKSKLGGAEMASSFQHKVEDDVEEKYLFFKSENDGKRNVFIVSFEQFVLH